MTNIDREHLDHYSGAGRKSPRAFAQFVSKDAFLWSRPFLCLDDENVQQILPAVNRRTLTYGSTAQADLRIVNSSAQQLGSEFQLELRGAPLGCFRVHVPGAHNVLNATAAIAVGLELEIAVDTIREALDSFTGVDRRFQIKGLERGVTVIDDYGHHPTEIRATLAAARACRYSKVHVLFQPHRYSRTDALMDDFARSFHQADSVHVSGYLCRPPGLPIEGVTAEALVERITAFGHRHADYVPTMDAGIEAVAKTAQAGEAIVTLGAGSVYQAGDRILEQLKKRRT